MLGCGSENEATDADGRKWLPDAKFISGSNSVQAEAQYQDPALGSEVPYMKARIFTSNATYKFPAKSKQRYFLRLHFYPSVYGSNNAEQAFFSVVANGITLLKNFSASITCKATTQAYIIREYSLAPLTQDDLEVTFSVDTGFAFVNGIELVAVPDGLFDKATLVGKPDESIDSKSSNLQTVYRLNVGGSFIPPTKDSASLGRAWYDDNAYIFGANVGIPDVADNTTKIEYENIPEYSAPVDVYTTARTMGPDKNININSNLTWVFNQVDTKYMYIVRLHFSDNANTKPNQVVFTIYINNQTAEPEADVIAWSGGMGKAVYKDYVTPLSEKSGGDLWLALHPNPDPMPEYYDSLLSGVEIFKIESSKSLAGPNPKPSDMLQKDEDEQKRSFETKKDTDKGSNKAHVIGGAAGGAAAAGVVAALCIAVYQRKKRVQGTESHSTSWLPIYGNSHTSGKSSSGKSHGSRHISSAAQGRCRRFSFAEMKQATKNFDEANVIGVGGFGKVYKGVIDNGATKVAIKKSNPQSEQGVNEFQTEIEMLSELRHKHLVSLIGFCEEDDEMCLVYDYMSRGTLREHIYKGNKTHLSWKQRLEICIGAAKGLHYLHTGARWTIIHRDVKTTNILLDENWEAKVSDFGLSKTGPDLNKGHVSTVVKGSFGYLDPEYFKRQQLTEKSDVYSFGVVLFEVLCARPALNPNLPKEQVSLADWALHCQKKGILEDIIDPHLKGKVNMESIKKFADTAEKCLSECGVDRPSLNDILWNLEFSLQLQEGTDGVLRNQEMMAIHYSNLSLGSESDLGEVQPSSSSDNNEAAPDSDSAIFSQIVNPTGR
ncbi:receptor-like protein kinase ANXUR2 isoform X2 [Argentina anserina]|uniref:receptor-like protein kinase ANXUR2 isoform X2 n=1 Tax=Argentina anserina TaxID=57926 RepID=UPI0021765B3F|nr:receptor-like protein kinase ANXUR2 isoform X2 [Potentilla anserina]